MEEKEAKGGGALALQEYEYLIDGPRGRHLPIKVLIAKYLRYCVGPDGQETPVATVTRTTSAKANAGMSTASYSLTGCHMHGDTQYCYLPNGEETIISSSPTITPTGPATALASTTAAAQTTAITDCHQHGSTPFCVGGNKEEWMVMATGTPTGELPAQYTGCHSHGEERYCMEPDGGEVRVVAAGAAEENSGQSSEEGSGQDCHFHAGVEHCISPGESESGGPSAPTCTLTKRDYNVPLRIGTIFVILVTSAIAVFGPILLTRFSNIKTNGVIFTVIKQFGTGVIIATALVHLLTHAQLMFANECIGRLTYEATATAIAMAGAFVAFLVEYLGNRFTAARAAKIRSGNGHNVEDHQNLEGSDQSDLKGENNTLAALGHHHQALLGPDDRLGCLVMEAGIIFHSILIGITLVVAGDSFFITLFVVIIFHQMFEGLALGARISTLQVGTSFKLLMALAFALITPVGMAIGVGVLNRFNGNDRSTIIAIGTLDSLSAGILLWVGLVEMLSHDWLYGDLRESSALRTTIALLSLMSGLALMGLLGKWA